MAAPRDGGGWEGGWGAGLSTLCMENVRGVEVGSCLEHLGSRLLCGPAGRGCARRNPGRGSPLCHLVQHLLQGGFAFSASPAAAQEREN